MSNSSNSLAISHLNGSLAKLAVSNSNISRIRHRQPKCLSALHLTSSSLDRKKDLVVVGPQAKQVLGNQGPQPVLSNEERQSVLARRNSACPRLGIVGNSRRVTGKKRVTIEFYQKQ